MVLRITNLKMFPEAFNLVINLILIPFHFEKPRKLPTLPQWNSLTVHLLFSMVIRKLKRKVLGQQPKYWHYYSDGTTSTLCKVFFH